MTSPSFSVAEGTWCLTDAVVGGVLVSLAREQPPLLVQGDLRGSRLVQFVVLLRRLDTCLW